MPRKPKVEAREKGLYRNGKRWWLRSVRAPLSGQAKPLSTGTDDLTRANVVARTARALAENRNQWEWLDLAVAGAVSLDTLATHHAASTLHLLRAERETVRAARDAAANDPDLEPWVKRWDEEHQAARVAAEEITQERRELALRYVRAFIPGGRPYPRSRFTEDAIKATMLALRHPKTAAPLAGPTLRKYVDALTTFYRYARKAHRANLAINPFDDADWVPANSDARVVAWEYEQSAAVLERMHGDRRAFAALVLGSGIELGAALALRGRDVGPGGDDLGRWVVAHATTKGKNGAREQRKIFVRRWAWELFHAHAKTVLPTASLWQTINPVNRGRDIRDSFYEAQLAAGLIDEPPRNLKTGKRLWKSVSPLHIHDGRHTFINVTALGLDGERRLTVTEQVHQLGHTDDTMIRKVYGKLNLEQRLKLIELAEERRAGKQEGEAAKAAGGD